VVKSNQNVLKAVIKKNAIIQIIASTAKVKTLTVVAMILNVKIATKEIYK
tara:strand:+ start:394 stop:543 length:150 start_codon:yes stop_codon:yes gene_type:complete